MINRENIETRSTSGPERIFQFFQEYFKGAGQTPRAALLVIDEYRSAPARMVNDAAVLVYCLPVNTKTHETNGTDICILYSITEFGCS